MAETATVEILMAFIMLYNLHEEYFTMLVARRKYRPTFLFMK
jgi:hypothetical protein